MRKHIAFALAVTASVLTFLLCWQSLLGTARFRAGRDSLATVRSPRMLSEDEMKSVRGGHGGTTCTACAGELVRMDECAHFSYDDPCLTNKCIQNYFVEDSCELSEQGACYAKLEADVPSWFQYLRWSNTSCQTNNPSTWQLFRRHYYGFSCNIRNYYLRCQTTPELGCYGGLISATTYYNAIQCY